jgi:hypothetical protein
MFTHTSMQEINKHCCKKHNGETAGLKSTKQRPQLDNNNYNENNSTN